MQSLTALSIIAWPSHNAAPVVRRVVFRILVGHGMRDEIACGVDCAPRRAAKLTDVRREIYSRTIKFSYHDAMIKVFGHNNVSPSKI